MSKAKLCIFSDKIRITSRGRIESGCPRGNQGRERETCQGEINSSIPLVRPNVGLTDGTGG